MYNAKVSFLDSVFGSYSANNQADTLAFPRGKQIRPSEGKDKDFENYGETGRSSLVKKAIRPFKINDRVRLLIDVDTTDSTLPKAGEIGFVVHIDEDDGIGVDLRDLGVFYFDENEITLASVENTEVQSAKTSSLGEAISDFYSIDDIRRALNAVTNQISSASFLEKPELQEISLTLQGLLSGLDNVKMSTFNGRKVKAAEFTIEGANVIVSPGTYQVIDYTTDNIAAYSGSVIVLDEETIGEIIEELDDIGLINAAINNGSSIIEVTEQDISRGKKQAKKSTYNEFVSKYLKEHPDSSIGDKDLSDAWKKEKSE